MSCLDLWGLSALDSLISSQVSASSVVAMATELMSIDELDRRHVAAWEEYLHDHAPENTRRQVFTGGDEVTDRRRAYHIEMAALDNEVFATRGKLQQVREDRRNWSKEEVHLRALLMDPRLLLPRSAVYLEPRRSWKETKIRPVPTGGGGRAAMRYARPGPLGLGLLPCPARRAPAPCAGAGANCAGAGANGDKGADPHSVWATLSCL
jgi:hypothetical protein